jgi:hypothetical protein
VEEAQEQAGRASGPAFFFVQQKLRWKRPGATGRRATKRAVVSTPPATIFSVIPREI